MNVSGKKSPCKVQFKYLKLDGTKNLRADITVLVSFTHKYPTMKHSTIKSIQDHPEFLMISAPDIDFHEDIYMSIAALGEVRV